jgi:hypothetical protein
MSAKKAAAAAGKIGGATEAMAGGVTDEGRRREDDRLWAFTLHEDGVFTSRQNLFLVAESMLVVAYTTALEASAGGDSALVIAIIALLLTLAWLYASARHSRIVESVQEHAKARFPEYARLYEARKWRLLPVRSRTITAFVVPLLVGALWVALLIAQP